MQVRDIVMHPYLKREEELLGVIYKLRMVAADQLATVMGISSKYVQMLKSSLNKEGDMVVSHYSRRRGARRLPFPPEYKSGPRMYALGPSGKAVVEAILDQPVYLKKHTGRQAVHYFGVNDVLVRTLTRLIEQESQGQEDHPMARVRAWERLQWLNSREAVEILEMAWAPILEDQKKKDQKEFRTDWIHPDGRIIIDGKAYWLEYDNMTEQIRNPEGTGRATTIEDKMARYLFSMSPIQNTDPVIWITPSPLRRDNMKKVYEEIKEENSEMPEMIFCSPGEEQSILLS